MNNITFYNRYGKPIAYTDDGKHIYLFSGKPVAYFYDESVYGFNGKHLGRFIDGWIRDNNGNCVFFTEKTRGSGPIKPIRQIAPIKSIKNIKPIKSIKQIRPVKPVNTLSWSSLSSEVFFNNQ